MLSAVNTRQKLINERITDYFYYVKADRYSVPYDTIKVPEREGWEFKVGVSADLGRLMGMTQKQKIDMKAHFAEVIWNQIVHFMFNLDKLRPDQKRRVPFFRSPRI